MNLDLTQKVLSAKDFAPDGLISSIVKTKRRRPFGIINKVFIDLKTAYLKQNVELTPAEFFITFIEISCFFSSIGKSLSSISGKKVLIIGPSKGEEIFLLNMLGIDAIGVEVDIESYNFANKMAELFPALNKNRFINDDITAYLKILTDKNIKYDYVVGRNLNPLSNFPEVLSSLKEYVSIYPETIALLQWDALYLEKEAIDLYDFRNGVLYNENLHKLLDNFHFYILKKGRVRGRFLYKIVKNK